MAVEHAGAPIFGRRWGLGLSVLNFALLFGVLEAAQVSLRWRLTNYPGTFREALAAALPPWLALAAFVPAIWALAVRFRLDRTPRAAALSLHLGASVVFAMVHIALNALNAATFGGMEAGAVAALQHLAGLYFVARMLSYWAVLAGCHALLLYREARARDLSASRLEAQLSEARLQALRGQLNPHFLFNTMNGIATLALRGEREGVVDALSRLSDLLRLSLDDDIGQEVTLARELDFTERYVGLQRLRFGDRLVLRRDVDADVLEARVPVMILQPLVENAIEHGTSRRPEHGEVGVRAYRDGERLVLEVNDSGPGFELQSTMSGRGIGLANTRARLATLYGPEAHLLFGSAPGGGAMVRIALPFHR